NTFDSCRFTEKADNSEPVIRIGNGAAPTFGLERTAIIGCQINTPSDGIGIRVMEQADRTVITGNAIRAFGAGSMGVLLDPNTTNSVIVGNGLNVSGTKIQDNSGDAATAAALVAAAALNP